MIDISMLLENPSDIKFLNLDVNDIDEWLASILKSRVDSIKCRCFDEATQHSQDIDYSLLNSRDDIIEYGYNRLIGLKDDCTKDIKSIKDKESESIKKRAKNLIDAIYQPSSIAITTAVVLQRVNKCDIDSVKSYLLSKNLGLGELRGYYKTFLDGGPIPEELKTLISGFNIGISDQECRFLISYILMVESFIKVNSYVIKCLSIIGSLRDMEDFKNMVLPLQPEI